MLQQELAGTAPQMNLIPFFRNDDPSIIHRSYTGLSEAEKEYKVTSDNLKSVESATDDIYIIEFKTLCRKEGANIRREQRFCQTEEILVDYPEEVAHHPRVKLVLDAMKYTRSFNFPPLDPEMESSINKLISSLNNKFDDYELF